MGHLRRSLFALAVAAALSGLSAPVNAQKTLRAVMHSDLKILDPIWTTAYIVRNHGYMIYDTLFATDEKGEIKPQMVGKYDVSADQLTHTFTLREGLLWHDGQPVTAEDCVASIKRWAAKDSTGQKLMSFVDNLAVKDEKSFSMTLKAPTGLVLLGLGKPSSNVPFMMPKRVAETDPNTQISDFTGSGPFVFKRDEWKPGDKTVYVKFDKYKPRSEPASGFAGGKVANVDRVEWRAISDHQQAINALLAGEIDFVEAPPHDLLPLAIADSNVKLYDWNVLGNQFTFRPNWTAKPFDNAKIPLRGVVEYVERWPVQGTFVRGKRLFQVLELDHHNRLLYSSLVGLSRFACNDHATSQCLQRARRKLRIFGNSGRIRH